MSGARPVPDPRATLRACHERRLEREGIPMFLAVVDERPGRTWPETAPTREGTALAELTGTYADALLPSRRDDDPLALITVLQVLAYAHLHPSQVAGPHEDVTGEGGVVTPSPDVRM